MAASTRRSCASGSGGWTASTRSCSLTARGLTTGEVSAHVAEVYGAKVSKDTISRITDTVVEAMTEWCNRPLDRVYPVMFIDAIVVKVRDGQVVNRPIYVVIGVTVNGERDILGLWAGDGSEGAKFWLAVLTEINNRGVEDVCIAVYDGLKGLPESITTTWQYTQVQACILHLIRNTFRFASRRDWDELARDLKPVYTAPNAAMASVRFDEFADTWGDRYPAIIRLWRNAWSEFIRFSTTTSKSAGSSARPTRSSRSTPATAGPSEPEATSRPNRPR
jgi:transposase-like protein